MPTFLLKTEPSDYSWDDLVRDGGTTWSGVTNPGALIHLRAARKGDEAFIYHTGDEKRIVGLARIASDPKEAVAKGRKSVDLRVEALAPAKTPVALAAIRADKRFASFDLVRNTRLSAMPVPPALDAILRELTGLAAAPARKGAKK